MPPSRVVAAPDKFRGTATAAEVAVAVCAAASGAGWDCDLAPVADGGEGLLEALGGTVRRTVVRGPLGEPVEAEWRLVGAGRGARAVVETARAAGLALVGGPEGNDPLAATTAGVGELVGAAVAAGARRVVVGAGGSATTDGGLGAVTALEPHARLRGLELVVACDVTTTFVDAARVFAPQKGATPAQVALLERRLERLAQVYREDFGVDVAGLAGSGAAGGLGGGLAALGAALVPGFELVAEATNLAERIEAADLVVTGEGSFDLTSLDGKAVGGVVGLAAAAGVPALVVAGEVDPEAAAALAGAYASASCAAPSASASHPGAAGVTAVSLVERFGRERAVAETAACAAAVVTAHLARYPRWA